MKSATLDDPDRQRGDISSLPSLCWRRMKLRSMKSENFCSPRAVRPEHSHLTATWLQLLPWMSRTSPSVPGPSAISPEWLCMWDRAEAGSSQLTHLGASAGLSCVLTASQDDAKLYILIPLVRSGEPAMVLCTSPYVTKCCLLEVLEL